jgi:hypothetical protein
VKLEDVLSQLREDAALEVFRPYWEDSVASLGDSVPPFLTVDEIRRNLSWSRLAPETEAVLLDAAARIRQEPALVLLAWHCYRLLFEHLDYDKTREWPTLESALRELCGAFYLLIALALVPRVLALHHRMGVPEEITRDTCQQIACFSMNYRRMTDGWVGIPIKQLYWLRHYDAGRLFRVGRFECSWGLLPRLHQPEDHAPSRVHPDTLADHPPARSDIVQPLRWLFPGCGCKWR